MNKLKSESVKTNLFLQIIYKILILGIPFFTAPYLTRVLGDYNLGVYNFNNSIAYYFVIIANLGIVKHATRHIAQHKDNEENLRKSYWSLFTIHLITSSFAILAFLLFSFFIKTDRNVYFLNTIYLLSVLFDITWLFYGLEFFKPVVITNILIKICSVSCLFLFVKKQSDLGIYIIISYGALLISNLITFLIASLNIKPIKIKFSDLKIHFKPMIYLAVTGLAVSLYTVFDKTLIGLMMAKENVAYYEYSNKIIHMFSNVLATIGTVMMPRMCVLLKNNDIENVNLNMKNTAFYLGFAGFPLMFGLMGIANDFAVFYFGEGWAICGGIMMALAPMIMLVAIGDILRTQYIIPQQKDKFLLIVVCINAVVNIIISLSLMPLLGIFGAIIGSFCAEFVGFVIECFYMKKRIKLGKVFVQLVPSFICALLMFAFVFSLEMFILPKFTNLGYLYKILIEVSAGVIVYAALVLLLIFINPKIKNKLFGKLLKKKKES